LIRFCSSSSASVSLLVMVTSMETIFATRASVLGAQASLAKIAADPFFEIAGLTYIQHRAGVVVHPIDAGPLRQLFQEVFTVELPAAFACSIRPCGHQVTQTALPSEPTQHRWRFPTFQRFGNGSCSRFLD